MTMKKNMVLTHDALRTTNHELTLIIDGSGNAQFNMDKDKHLFEEAHPVIRFYTWREKSYSIGCFQSVEEVKKILPEEDKDCPIVHRITGGGVVEHGDDVTFSIILPNPEDWGLGNAHTSYHIINNMILSTLSGCNKDGYLSLYNKDVTVQKYERKNYFCFRKPTRYDLMHQGIKIGGGAQRRSGNRFLHQGCLYRYMDNSGKKEFIGKFYNKFLHREPGQLLFINSPV